MISKETISKTERWEEALEIMQDVGFKMNKLFDLLALLGMPKAAKKMLDMAEEFGHLCYDIRHSYPKDLKEADEDE